MSASKEAELITAVMLYAVRCFAEGDLPALKEMNFGPRELGALREISRHAPAFLSAQERGRIHRIFKALRASTAKRRPRM